VSRFSGRYAKQFFRSAILAYASIDLHREKDLRDRAIRLFSLPSVSSGLFTIAGK